MYSFEYFIPRASTSGDYAESEDPFGFLIRAGIPACPECSSKWEANGFSYRPVLEACGHVKCSNCCITNNNNEGNEQDCNQCFRENCIKNSGQSVLSVASKPFSKSYALFYGNEPGRPRSGMFVSKKRVKSCDKKYSRRDLIPKNSNHLNDACHNPTNRKATKFIIGQPKTKGLKQFKSLRRRKNIGGNFHGRHSNKVYYLEASSRRGERVQFNREATAENSLPSSSRRRRKKCRGRKKSEKKSSILKKLFSRRLLKDKNRSTEVPETVSCSETLGLDNASEVTPADSNDLTIPYINNKPNVLTKLIDSSREPPLIDLTIDERECNEISSNVPTALIELPKSTDDAPPVAQSSPICSTVPDQSLPEYVQSSYVDLTCSEKLINPSEAILTSAGPAFDEDNPNEVICLDDFCTICLESEGGILLQCKNCPKLFHPNCHLPKVESASNGDWQCMFCISIISLLDKYPPVLEERSGITSNMSIRNFQLVCKFICELYKMQESLIVRRFYEKYFKEYMSIAPVSLRSIGARLTLGLRVANRFRSVDDVVTNLRKMFFQAALFYNKFNCKENIDVLSQFESRFEQLLAIFFPHMSDLKYDPENEEKKKKISNVVL